MQQFPVVSLSTALALSCVLVSVGCRPQPPVYIGGSGSSNGNGSGGNGTGQTASGGAVGAGSGGGVGSGGTVGSGSGGHVGGTASGGITAGGSGGANGSGGGSGSGGGKTACGDTTPPADPKMPGYPAEQHTKFAGMAMSLLANLSTSEKADQMRGVPQPTSFNNDIFRQPDNTAHNIKGFMFRDGPRGVNLDAPINGGGSRGRSTVYPVPAARGATFDVDLEYQIGQAMGDEMVASNQTMLLSPTTNILRHPRWGRSQETYGEDVFLLGRMGTANVAGIQEYVPACAKHYAANNIENSRSTKTSAMDERTFREIYARHFEMMIKDGGVACVMAAYNAVSVPGKSSASCTQNGYILNDVLRKDFGFQGFTMTDWWALSGNNSAATGTTATATAAVNAGLDMELPNSINYKLLESIVGSGIQPSQIDTAAARVLEQKARFNVVTGNGLKSSSSSYSAGSISNQAHVDLAEKAAREGMVLLQNKGNVLPLKKSGKIAVVGTKEDYAGNPGINNKGDDINNGTIDFPNGVRVGDVGSSRVDFDPAKAIGPAKGIQQVGGSSVTVVSGNDAATASGADAIVIVAGLTPYDEGEEYNGSGDRTSLDLNGKLNSGMQNGLIMQVAAANPGKPIIVVLEGGGAININMWKDMVSAVIMAWYPGMVGGQALGELLFGDHNFSGKLPVSWPNSVNDYPTFDTMTATTQMDYYLGYRYLENKGTPALYPFGYGLSYSGKFQYSNLQVPCSSAKAPTDKTPGSIVDVKVDITNSSAVDGTEVALLFASSAEVAKQLKGFVRVDVPAGKTVTATIPLRIVDLKYWDTGSGAWKYPAGPVTLMVGRSSAGSADTKDDLALTDTLTID